MPVYITGENMPIQITAVKKPKPGDERTRKYIKKRDEGVTESNYQAAIRMVDESALQPFEDLSAIDEAVGSILTDAGIYGRRRTAYLSFARELYKFMRRYGSLPAELVASKVSEYTFLEGCDRGLLERIATEVFGVGAGAGAGGGTVTL